MGVPTFYRWLCSKYPRVVKDAIEEKQEIDKITGKFVPADLSSPNPSGITFDNLYIDMNGVVHPCAHPEDSPPPKDEEEMFNNLCEYLDRIVNIVRPRKLIYLALDGVAPRAKMNQQRSRRFKAASEMDVADEAYEELKTQFESEGREICAKQKKWDSNVITPGTGFMDRLANVLRYYVAKRMTESSYWARLIVLLSDSNKPGEGEHKVMKFVRTQRQRPDYDPNTTHCMHGMDADLIMLGLATHEAHFYIIREVVTEDSGQETAKCANCGKPGHHVFECRTPYREGLVLPNVKEAVKDDVGLLATKATFQETWKPLQFLQLPVLREYMESEFTFPPEELIDSDPETGRVTRVPSELEKHIDDFVLMCFFVGNDFLPHLPSISIHKGSIDLMITLYRAIYPSLGGYLCNEGVLNVDVVQKFCTYLAQAEPEILQQDHDRKVRDKRQREERERAASEASRKRQIELSATDETERSGLSAPSEIPPALRAEVPELPVEVPSKKRKLGAGIATDSLRDQVDAWRAAMKKLLEEKSKCDDPEDNVELGSGDPQEYRIRYYKQKFDLEPGDDVQDVARRVAAEFVRGLQWVLLYYYQGCPSWEWYYPYHYAPLAVDIHRYGFLETSVPFSLGKPFSPLEQLMSNLPPRSAEFLPKCLGTLMVDDESPLADFYPRKFQEDQDGKRWKWQWVARLPFIDGPRLRRTAQAYYHLLTEEEHRRNSVGNEILFVADSNNPLHELIRTGIKEAINITNKHPSIGGTLEPLSAKEILQNGVALNVNFSSFPPFTPKCLTAAFIHPEGQKHTVTLPPGVIPPVPQLRESDKMGWGDAPRNNRFNTKNAMRLILKFVGGRHYEKFKEQERSQIESRRSYFHQVMRPLNANPAAEFFDQTMTTRPPPPPPATRHSTGPVIVGARSDRVGMASSYSTAPLGSDARGGYNGRQQQPPQGSAAGYHGGYRRQRPDESDWRSNGGYQSGRRGGYAGGPPGGGYRGGRYDRRDESEGHGRGGAYRSRSQPSHDYRREPPTTPYRDQQGNRYKAAAPVGGYTVSRSGTAAPPPSHIGGYHPPRQQAQPGAVERSFGNWQTPVGGRPTNAVPRFPTPPYDSSGNYARRRLSGDRPNYSSTPGSGSLPPPAYPHSGLGGRPNTPPVYNQGAPQGGYYGGPLDRYAGSMSATPSRQAVGPPVIDRTFASQSTGISIPSQHHYEQGDYSYHQQQSSYPRQQLLPQQQQQQQQQSAFVLQHHQQHQQLPTSFVQQSNEAGVNNSAHRWSGGGAGSMGGQQYQQQQRPWR